jgi:hypothetical protein
MSHCLYRHYDADKVLLYVGVSATLIQRTTQHRRGAAWFERVRIITVQHFKTRRAAEKAEAVAIASEKPLFNLTHADNEYKERRRSVQDWSNPFRNRRALYLKRQAKIAKMAEQSTVY